MQWLELTRCCLWQSRKAVVTLHQCVVRGDDCFALHQPYRRYLTRTGERESGLLFVKFLKTGRHPEALTMNLVHQTPVHRRRAGSQSLIYTIAESHTLDERKAIWQRQAHLYTWNTVLC